MASTLQEVRNVRPLARNQFRCKGNMSDAKESNRNRLERLNRLIETVCGIYSRVGNRLRRDRSYVSRVARGERRSPEVESALLTEFDRIESEYLS